jgi:hypothetical protein
VDNGSRSPETVAVQDEQPRRHHLSQGVRRWVTGRSDLDGAMRPLPSLRHVAGQHPLIGTDDREPRVRRRVVPTLEQPLRSGQPAAHRCHERSVEQQVHRDPHGRSRGGDVVTGLHARRVGALPRVDGRIQVARRVGDLAESRQVARCQEALPVGLREQDEGPLPVAAGCRLTGALDETSTSAIAHCTPPDPRLFGARG